MDNNEPIPADELQMEIDRLKEVFRGDNLIAKFDASAKMMVLVSRYLSNNIQAIDVEPITAALEEYARITNGGKPEFIKSEKSGGGRLVTLGTKCIQLALWRQWIYLQKNGYSVSEAVRFVAEKLGREAHKIKNLRSDFNRRQMLPEIENFKRQQPYFKT